MLKLWCVSNNSKSKTKSNILKSNLDFIWFLSDCVKNVLSGVVPINKTKIQKFETALRQLSNNKIQRTVEK